MTLLKNTLNNSRTAKILPLISFQISSFIIPWLIIIWYTYSEDLQAAGNFSFALAVIAPISILLASPSRNYLLTQDVSQRYAFISRLLLMGCGLIPVFLLGLQLNAMWLFSILFLFKSAELLYDLPISSAIANNQIKQLWLLNLSKWTVIALLSGVAYFTHQIEAILLLGFFCFIVIQLLNIDKKHHAALLKPCFTLIRHSMPLGISTLVFAIHFNVPRYILSAFEQTEALAIYSISSFLIMAAVVLVNIIVQAQLPRLTMYSKENDKRFRALVIKLVLAILSIIILIQLAHWSFFSSMFWQLHNNVQLKQPEFSLIYQDTIMLAWGPLIFSVANYFLMISGQHKLLLKLTTVNLLLTTVLAYIGYQYYGFFAMLIGYNLGCLLQGLVIYHLFNSRTEVCSD